jgi:hypothetical protein
MQGGRCQVPVEVKLIGEAQNISLSAKASLGGIDLILEPISGTSNFTSSLNVYVTDSTPAGNYSVEVTAFGDGQTAKASLVLSVFHGDVTVSGWVHSQLLCKPYQSSLLRIQFTDIQTGTQTPYYFLSIFPILSPSGNYSVALMNEHTYNVTIDYYRGSPEGQFYHTTDFVGCFTVHTLSGETVVSKDFP